MKKIEKSIFKKSRNPQSPLTAGRWRRQRVTLSGNVPYQMTAEPLWTHLEERSLDAVSQGRQQVHHLHLHLHLYLIFWSLDDLNTITMQGHLQHRQPVDQDQQHSDVGAAGQGQSSKEPKRTPVMPSPLSSHLIVLFHAYLSPSGPSSLRSSTLTRSTITRSLEHHHWSRTTSGILNSILVSCVQCNSIPGIMCPIQFLQEWAFLLVREKSNWTQHLRPHILPDLEVRQL